MSKTRVLTVEDIFEMFGGPAEVGRIIGTSTMHAKAMRRRGSIPVKFWPRLVEYAEAGDVKTITYKAVTLAHAQQKRRRAA